MWSLIARLVRLAEIMSCFLQTSRPRAANCTVSGFEESEGSGQDIAMDFLGSCRFVGQVTVLNQWHCFRALGISFLLLVMVSDYPAVSASMTKVLNYLRNWGKWLF